jgi:hypothetical protein
VNTRSSKLNLNLCWATFGFTHYKIDDNVGDILSDILTSHISPFDNEWKVNNEEGDICYEDEIRIMNPLKYKDELKKKK